MENRPCQWLSHTQPSRPPRWNNKGPCFPSRKRALFGLICGLLSEPCLLITRGHGEWGRPGRAVGTCVCLSRNKRPEFLRGEEENDDRLSVLHTSQLWPLHNGHCVGWRCLWLWNSETFVELCEDGGRLEHMCEHRCGGQAAALWAGSRYALCVWVLLPWSPACQAHEGCIFISAVVTPEHPHISWWSGTACLPGTNKLTSHSSSFGSEIHVTQKNYFASVKTVLLLKLNKTTGWQNHVLEFLRPKFIPVLFEARESSPATFTPCMLSLKIKLYDFCVLRRYALYIMDDMDITFYYGIFRYISWCLYTSQQFSWVVYLEIQGQYISIGRMRVCVLSLRTEKAHIASYSFQPGFLSIFFNEGKALLHTGGNPVSVQQGCLRMHSLSWLRCPSPLPVLAFKKFFA